MDDTPRVLEWKARIRKALQATPDHAQMVVYGEVWCERAYIIGQKEDADIVLACVLHDDELVVFSQIGCSMFFGVAVPARIAKYFEAVGGPGQESANGLARDFVQIVAEGFANGYDQMFVPARLPLNDAFRAFRVPFGDARMTGHEIQDFPISYNPRMN